MINSLIFSSAISAVIPWIVHLLILKNNLYHVYNCASPLVSYSISLFGFILLGLIFFTNLNKLKSKLFPIGYGFIFGAASYNLLTRVFSGCVLDYISFFNIADIFIVIGLSMVIYVIVK